MAIGVLSRTFGRNLERLQLDVGLVKTIEEHQRVGAMMIGPAREMHKIGEEGTELHRDRYFQLRFDRRQDGEVFGFDFFGRPIRIGGNRINVQLQCIGARLARFRVRI